MFFPAFCTFLLKLGVRFFCQSANRFYATMQKSFCHQESRMDKTEGSDPIAVRTSSRSVCCLQSSVKLVILPLEHGSVGRSSRETELVREKKERTNLAMTRPETLPFTQLIIDRRIYFTLSDSARVIFFRSYLSTAFFKRPSGQSQFSVRRMPISQPESMDDLTSSWLCSQCTRLKILVASCPYSGKK